ncbi:hypothetical protein HBI07_231980 [Parastagonospora nodorum]|nr:hypothetical protein HBI07_231980 [Parastagonospora nodorum]
MDRFCTICGFYSTVIVYNHIKKDKNADLAIADGISDALDMCAKDDLIYDRRLAGELATAESVTAKDPNHVDTFGSDFAFSFAVWLQRIKCTLGDVNSLFADNILSLIAFIISYRLFADELVYALNGATVVLIIILCITIAWASFCYVSLSTTILACIVEHCCLLSNTALENAAKSGILLACADGRIRQCYLTICRCLDKGHDDFVYLVDCFGWKHYNFNIYVSLATDTLHLLLKGLLVAVVSLLFVLKAPFALHFIRAVCDLVILAQYKKYILQICLHNSQRTALLAADYATVVKQRIQPYSTKLLLSEVAANIAISDFTYAAAVFIYLSIKCWRSSGKRHNDSEHCDEEVVRCVPNWQQTGLWRRDYVWLYLILTIIDYTCYDKDRKHMAYIRAFSEVLLFNNNGQIDNTTGMLSVRQRAWNAAPKRRILQAFKFYDLSTIIRLVHLVLRDLPDLTTRTTMSYYVNNYIDWDEYNRLYLLTFDINLLRMLREY